MTSKVKSGDSSSTVPTEITDAANSVVEMLEQVYSHNEDVEVRNSELKSRGICRVVIQDVEGGLVASYNGIEDELLDTNVTLNDMLAHNTGHVGLYLSVDGE